MLPSGAFAIDSRRSFARAVRAATCGVAALVPPIT
jgi:hypothetical protein